MSYDNADFYDCCDPESLSHETPEEAIEYFLDDFLTPDCDVAATICRHSPIIVRAYRRDEVSPAWIEALANSMTDLADETWSEEYGDPNCDDGFKPGPYRSLKAEIKELLKVAVAQHPVWWCLECGERKYSAEQVIAMMRTSNPDWF